MPQYQVDSEQIQSSSAAVNASIQSIRQAVQANKRDACISVSE